MRGIEVVLLWIVVGRGGNHHEIGINVGRSTIQRRHKIQLQGLAVGIVTTEVFFNVFILNG